MKKIAISFVLIGAFLLNGCIPIIIGVAAGAGAVVGYSLSNDTASGNVKTDYRSLWDLTMETLKGEDADIAEVNESKGTIKAKIDEYTLTARIDTLSQDTQRLKVTARKGMFPKPDFAQKIFFKITDKLK